MTKNPQERHVDIIIVGGGMAGLVQALVLANEGAKVVCIDRADPAAQVDPAFDGRTVAVSNGSRRVLERAGIWQSIEGKGCPIRSIDIMEEGSTPLLQFDAAEVEEEAFGWIIQNRDIRLALFEAATRESNLTHAAPEKIVNIDINEDVAAITLDSGTVYKAALLIGADGRNSYVRDWLGIETRGRPYHQVALTCNFCHENPHDNIAIEDFRKGGPFAVLPMLDGDGGQHRSSLVWSAHGTSHPMAKLDEEALIRTLEEHLPERYGKVTAIDRRFFFPLSLTHARAYTAPRAALISDAAHAIHPIAGQGLNLGFRDVAVLADLIANAREAGEDIGGRGTLEKYARARRADNVSMIAATDSLNALFSNDILPLKLARRFGLRGVAKLPPAKKFFMRQAMGLGSQVN